jgi:hypothetical protein
MHRLVGPLAASNGFVMWLVFAIQPGGQVREAWNTTAYWAIGLPLLAVMHAAVGAALRRGAWWLPACTLGGHLLAIALMQPPGFGPDLMPKALLLVGLPFYAALALAGWAGQTVATLREA